MKISAAIRIILFSILILILVAALVVGLAAHLFSVNTQGGHFTTSEEISVSGAQVRNLEIQWASGSINILPGDGDVITATEAFTGTNDYPMAFAMEGDTLVISYSDRAIRFGFNMGSFHDKDLTVLVPKDWICDELEVSCASADLTVTGLKAKKIQFDAASGEGYFEDCITDELEVSTASGNIHYIGEARQIHCDGASAKLKLEMKATPETIDIETASGDALILLPKNSGFTVQLHALSGDFDSDFSMAKQKDRYICGDGACKISFDGASGNITVNKAN